MAGRWIVSSPNVALTTWNDKLGEIWQRLTRSPQPFKDGRVWSCVGERAFNLLVLVGAVKGCDRIVKKSRGL